MANINFEVNTNSIENKSQVVLRTNPYLTSNVKLVIDSNGDLSLDSFSANRVLSNQQYKKFPIDSNSHYAYDLAQYYKETPIDTIYDVWRKESDLSVYVDYERQYEEQYQYGARLNDSKLYENNIRFLAPLWLESDLPEYFVIYRIDEPVSGNSLDDTYSSINSRIMDMLKNAKLIATFDMKNGSKIGDYLNNYVNDPKFPFSPLTVSFESDSKTSWNGIDVVKGGFTSKGEYIHNDFMVKDRLEILNNQLITEGFKRNKMVCANLINLEFIFDDPSVEPYDVNRYIGFYVKAHQEGQFKAIDYRKGILRINTSTVSSTYDLTGTSLTPISMLPNNDLGLPVLQWIKNRGQFYNVLNDTSTKPFELKVPGMEDAILNGYIQKNDTLQIESTLPSLKDFFKLEVIETPMDGERWIVASKSEWDTVLDENEFTITADSTLAAGTNNGRRFSTLGNLDKIAYSIVNAINSIQDSPFKVTRVGTVIYIEHNSVGNRLHRSFFAKRSTNTTNAIDVKVGEYDNTSQYLNLGSLVYTNWQAYYPIGGSNSGLGFLVDLVEIGDIDSNTYIKTRDELYHKIIDVVEDPYNIGKYRICLSSNKITPELLYGTSFNLYVESYIEWGKFEAFNFIDFDFDFFSTDNSDPKELQYESYESIDPSNPILLEAHFEDSTPMYEDWSTYYNQLEAIKGKVTPTSTGVTFINSEYDRLQENFLKETSTLSRAVPFINKWVYKNSVNCKEKPYYLSVSEAFGKTNFSPDIEISERRAKSMTHEWFYLYKYPKYSDLAQDATEMGDPIRKFYSYIQPDESINLQASDLLSVTENWFDRLFVYEGIQINGDWVPTQTAKKYSVISKGSPFAPAETMFRGLKVKFYARKEFTESNPRNLINTADFNDYKFSVVVNYNYQNTDELTYKVIQNRKWKTITFYIELNTSEENLSYVNRKLLYEMHSFLDSSGNYVTSNISGYLNFSTSYISSGNYLIVDGVNTALLRDIQLDPSGGYGSLLFSFYGYDFELPVVEVLSDMKLKVLADDSLGNLSDTSSSVTLNLPSLTGIQSSNIQLSYDSGGYNLAKSMFENIGARYVADLVNSNDTETIQYITVEEDGTQLQDRFIINIEDGNSFTKKSSVRVQADPFKPKSYKVSSGIIGYMTEELSNPTNVKLIRMNGDYTMAYRNVVTFTDIYKSNKLQQSLSTSIEERAERVYSKFNRLGIAFASYDNFGIDDYGIIRNSFYHKVNPEKADGILKLSVSGDASPVYPLINEIAIDRRNINVFRSSWEDQFYVKNGTQVQRELVFGTLSAHEESAFLASTLNLPKDSYYISSYSAIARYNSFQELKNVKASGSFKGNAAIFEDDSNVWIDLYLKTSLVNILINDNAGLSINKYVQASQSYGDKTSLADDIKQYVEVNLLKLMGVEEVRVWNIPSKSIQESQLLSADSLKDILDTTAKEEKSFRIEYDPNQPLNVRLIYNKRPGFRHQFYVYVKISS